MTRTLSLDPDLYTPPHITEVWGETQFVDCTWASGYGLIDIWTTGAATRDRDWWPYGQRRLKATREALRDASGDLVGGSTLEDLARGVAVYWPQLPALRRTTDGSADLDFAGMWAALTERSSVLLQGNPSRITNMRSFLRTAQGDDDYDHSILVIRARQDAALVDDPLRPARSRPRWVPREELRQFASRFHTPAGLPFYAIVRRGSRTTLYRTMEALKTCLEQQPGDCTNAKAAAREAALIQARDAVDALRSEEA